MDSHEAIDSYRFVSAALHLLPTVLWLILARSYWRSRGTERPAGALLCLFRALCGILVLHYGLNVIIDLIHPGTGRPSLAWTVGCVLTKATTLAELAVLRHLVPLATLGAEPPSRLWLAVNYGSAIAVGAASAWLGTFTPAAGSVVHLYLLAMSVAIVADVMRLARGRDGRWRPVIMADLGPSGFALVGSGIFAGVVLIVLVEQNRPGPDLVWASVHSAVGLALAAVFALRILGDVTRRFLVILASIAAAAAIFFGTRAAGAMVAERELRWLLDLGGVLALVLVLGPGTTWLESAVDRLVSRHSWRRDRQLLAFLQTLAPDLGVAGCCRRATQQLVEVLRLRGAGLLLAPPQAEAGSLEIVARGRLDLEPVAEVWPRGTDTGKLPRGAFDLLWLRDLDAQEALHDAGVTWVVPVDSPRRPWGHLFVAAGPLGMAAGGARLETLESFARQLALVLDSADLLARAVAVERELAQAGKLAAVGEMAARMAHEIRNPVTAARSLAQTLAREPNSPANAEHAGIITRELDRVEHQVRSLLEFARRETYRFEPVRLAELVRATVADLEPCLDGVVERSALALDLDPDVVVQADPERLRQVLINLVENAADALRDAPPPRRLTVSVAGAAAGTPAAGTPAAGSDTGATLAVRDSGPGVAGDVLPRIFDPFFSQKAQGTGLGLAIARRIVEAHGGRIEAEADPGGGMVFRVELPAVEPDREPVAGDPAVAGELQATA